MAVERDSLISTIVMRAKSPSDAWTIPKSVVEGDDSDTAPEGAENEFNENECRRVSTRVYYSRQ